MDARWLPRAAMVVMVAVCAPFFMAETCIEDFDDPLERVFSTSGDNLKFATSALGTQNGFRELQITVPGQPVAAFVFWAGDTHVGGDSDPSISLSGGKLNSKVRLNGQEVGRRHQVFADAVSSGCSGSGGETIMSAELPARAVARGFNRFTISDFNERSDVCDEQLINIYRQQYGVAMVVIYAEAAIDTSNIVRRNSRAPQSRFRKNKLGSKLRTCHTPGKCMRDVTIMLGADLASARSFTRGPNCEGQVNTEKVCFRLNGLSCDTTAELVVGMAGTQPLSESINGRVVKASQERTWFKDSTSPGELIDGGDMVEFNELIDFSQYYAGRSMSLMRKTVQVHKGASEACFQVEMLPQRTGEQPQNALLFLGALSVDRTCK